MDSAFVCTHEEPAVCYRNTQCSSIDGCTPSLLAISSRIGGNLIIASSKKCISCQHQRMKLAALYTPEYAGFYIIYNLIFVSVSSADLV